MLSYFKSTPTALELMSTRTWSEEKLQDLIELRGPPEGLHVEYKAGGLIDKNGLPKAKKELRRQIVGFANADGGVIIIGVGEDGDKTSGSRPHSLVPITYTAPSWDLETWLRDVLRESIYPRLLPEPRIAVFKGVNGYYAVMTVEPTLHTLVSCHEGNRLVYFARSGSSTEELDEWCVQAILLGTRRVPQIAVTVDQAMQRPFHPGPGGDAATNFVSALWVSNEGMTYLQGPNWGVVLPDCFNTRGGYVSATPVGELIRSRVQATCERLHHYMGTLGTKDLLPFQAVQVNINGKLDCPQQHRVLGVNYALYIVGQNSLPLWYAVSIIQATDGSYIHEIKPQDYEIPVGVLTSPIA